MKPATKNCLYCANEIKGRIDKRFCNPNCKSAYHNQNPNTDENQIREINKKLRKNRSALKTACPMGKATVRKSFLTKLGMNFTHISHIWKSQGGQVYYFCYDYGYCAVENPDKVLIIQKQNYMKDQTFC